MEAAKQQKPPTITHVIDSIDRYLREDYTTNYAPFQKNLRRFYDGSLSFENFVIETKELLPKNRHLVKKLDRAYNAIGVSAEINSCVDLIDHIFTAEKEDASCFESVCRLISLHLSHLISNSFFADQMTLLFSSYPEGPRESANKFVLELCHLPESLSIDLLIILSWMYSWDVFLLWDPMVCVPNSVSFYVMISIVIKEEEKLKSFLSCIWCLGFKIISMETANQWMEMISTYASSIFKEYITSKEHLKQLMPCNVSQHLPKFMARKLKIAMAPSVISFINQQINESKCIDVYQYLARFSSQIKMLTFKDDFYLSHESIALRYYSYYQKIVHYGRTSDIKDFPSIIFITKFFLRYKSDSMVRINSIQLNYFLSKSKEIAQRSEKIIYEKVLAEIKHSNHQDPTTRVIYKDFLKTSNIERHMVLTGHMKFPISLSSIQSVISQFEKTFETMGINGLINNAIKTSTTKQQGNKFIGLFLFYLNELVQILSGVDVQTAAKMLIEENLKVPYMLPSPSSNFDLVIVKLIQTAKEIENKTEIGDFLFKITKEDNCFIVYTMPNPYFTP